MCFAYSIIVGVAGFIAFIFLMFAVAGYEEKPANAEKNREDRERIARMM